MPPSKANKSAKKIFRDGNSNKVGKQAIRKRIPKSLFFVPIKKCEKTDCRQARKCACAVCSMFKSVYHRNVHTE